MKIAMLEPVTIGHSRQWVLQRSDDSRNPVILFVHGGPGTSQLSINRWYTRPLERHFTVVNWDQRGAGKSYRAITDTGRMNLGQIVDDTVELIRYLLGKLRHERVILAGHSWGSVVGALTVARHPELFHCYVGISQVANMKENEAASWTWTLEEARRRGNRGAVAALEAMGPPPYSGDWQQKTLVQRSWLARLGGEVHASGMGAVGFVLRNLIWSTEYSLADRVNVFRGIMGSMKLLWPELMTVDLFTAVPQLDVPVFFMEGRFDHEAPEENAVRYFDALRAPSKELIWFEHSAHLPNWEEPVRFNRILVEKVLPIASARGLAAVS